MVSGDALPSTPMELVSSCLLYTSDLGLQNENLILKAVECGFSTLIMGIRDADKIRELLAIPEEEVIVSVIAIGQAADIPSRPKRKNVDDVLSIDVYKRHG